jgi:NAD(P)-dependent dehydrogenase (short-subunit alcohol dehydrogenase family)
VLWQQTFGQSRQTLAALSHYLDKIKETKMGEVNGASRFKNQVALVVGGAQGIGKAIALGLGREGAQVVIADIDICMMEATVSEMRKQGLNARAANCDVRRADRVDELISNVIAWHHRIDILMYVSGIAPATPFLQMTEATWDDTLDTNLRGAFLVSQRVLPHMVEKCRGKLLFLASTNCWDAEAGLSHYNASKAGLYLLAKTLAREFGRYGITSNAVGPGFIKTRLTEPILRDREFMKKYSPDGGVIPLGRLGTPEDVAGPALFLVSEDASYVNGVLLYVDGGQLA